MNDDVHSMFMINMICTMANISMCLDSNDNDKVESLLENHGLQRNDVTYSDANRLLLNHMMNRLCAYNNSLSCCIASNLSSSEICQRCVNVLVSMSSNWVLICVVCEILGWSLDFIVQNHPHDILKEYYMKMITFDMSSVYDFFLM